MRRALLIDPFWVAPSEVLKLTDREMWEDYIRPALQKQKREEARERGDWSAVAQSVMRPDDPDGTVKDERGNVVPPEMVLAMLAGAGLPGARESLGEVIRKRREEETP